MQKEAEFLEEFKEMTARARGQVQDVGQTQTERGHLTYKDIVGEKKKSCYSTCESEISDGFSVKLLLSAGIRSLYFVLTSSSE